MVKIRRIRAKNFRCIKDACLDLGDITVLFGPNGAGKSTWLDTLWFVRDCCIRGVPEASADRSHGIGMLWSRSPSDAGLGLSLETDRLAYTLTFDFENGRIDPLPSELLEDHITEDRATLYSRRSGSTSITAFSENGSEAIVTLQDPEKLGLSSYLGLASAKQYAHELDFVLRHTRYYDSRVAALFELRRLGSDSDYRTVLWSPRAQNLWSVLRNLNDKRILDDRYSRIIHHMREAFPDFNDIVLEQTGPQSVYGGFMLKDMERPINASGVSSGHLQMLIHLTALFSDSDGNEPFILFDEPECSLHPHALAALAEAMKEAAGVRGRQIVIATHSPVLLSQFDPENIVAVEKDEDGSTKVQRIASQPGMKELLEEYAAGSLYMSEAIAPQGVLSDLRRTVD